MLAWLRDLTSRERRTMLACWGGWTLDGFDQQLYSYVVPTVIAVWGMSTGAAGTIGTVTVVTSAFGGWFAGALADRFGRVRVLQIAILWYSVFTFLCAFAQNFEQLFILRGLHGLGFGGEWATGAVLMGEVIRDKYRGRGVGFVQTGAAVGPGLAALDPFVNAIVEGRGPISRPTRACAREAETIAPAHSSRTAARHDRPRGRPRAEGVGKRGSRRG